MRLAESSASSRTRPPCALRAETAACHSTRGSTVHRRTAEERIAAIESLKREELLRFYEERYGAGAMLLVVVGDVDSDEVLDGLERRFGLWRRGLVARVPRPEPVAPARARKPCRCPTKDGGCRPRSPR